ncbi:hypothetical protein [Streptomyces canus]|uniref:hypothetical protein n=1 Tax=Streptomyces canus TaxID=58343 RepID=UPI002E32802F|nr:hypothetical protein [Streptomyces canus]
MTVPSTPQEPSPFVRRLRAGEQLPLPADSVAAWETFPFEGDLRVKPLQSPVLPEPARSGEDGPEECPTCRKPVTEALWSDDHWRLDAVGTESRLPAVVMLQPRGHYDLTDLPAERAAELGDGAAHLNPWLLVGLMRLRGTFLPVREELLPPLPDEERRRAHTSP